MDAPPDDKIRVALIEPEPRVAQRIKELVSAGSLPVVVSDAISAERPELERADIFLISLGGLDAPERETVARMHAGFPRTPLIVLGLGASVWAGEALRLGAQHVLEKQGLTAEKLSSTIRYYARYARGPLKD